MGNLQSLNVFSTFLLRLNLIGQKLNSTNPKMSSENACTYAALILQDEGMEISADNIATIVKAAGVAVEPFWPGLFASALASCNVADLITNIGSGMGSGPAAGGAAAGGAEAAPAAEEKKEESESEKSDSDMGFDLLAKISTQLVTKLQRYISIIATCTTE